MRKQNFIKVHTCAIPTPIYAIDDVIHKMPNYTPFLKNSTARSILTLMI